MKRKSITKRFTGFTLIELLVVISIIALLMGVLIPVVNKAKAAALSTCCKANLRNIAVAFISYLDDNNRYMPNACAMVSLKLNEKPPITMFLLRQLEQKDVFRCPADRKRDYLNKWTGETGYDKYFKSETTSYEFNTMLAGKHMDKFFLDHKFTDRNVHVMRDFDAFHGKKGKVNSYNYLYADGHVGNREAQQ
jgi:prepilin-type N-terminal cleavage/methylation domain-containing protein/prepilin-type processing-associated H-X9-DG protein